MILCILCEYYMNKTKTSQESLIEQPNFCCSRYVALRDVLGKIEGTAAVLIVDV
jgi:uncharacterized Fe-S cluster-containing MiaB family protein